MSDQKSISSTSSSSWQPTDGTHPSINLPLAFKIYCSKSRLTHSEFYIGHEKGQKLHAISGGYKGWFKATIGLHAGPGIDSPALGQALIKGKSVDVTLPSSGTTHSMHTHSSLSSNYIFEFLVGGSPTPESFEWRRSKGPEVESLDGRGKGGWVLLWIGQGAELGEPVAAYSVDLWSMKLSGHFAFFNSGRTSNLGANWAVMAILTALCLGQKRRDGLALSGTVAIS